MGAITALVGVGFFALPAGTIGSGSNPSPNPNPNPNPNANP